VNVHAKFRRRVSVGDRARVMRALRRAGASSVRRLFPRTVDADQAAHFVVTVGDEAAAQAMVTRLAALPQIEFAELAIRRRPM